MSSIQEQKAAHRKRVKGLLQKLSEKEIDDQSRKIHEKVWEMPNYIRAKSISIFLSMPGKEVSTREIVLKALRDGKQVFVPYIYSEASGSHSKVMDMLQLRNEEDFNSLKGDSWGIPSLSKTTIDQRNNALGGTGLLASIAENDILPCLDVVFVPAVAFDDQNSRLGHGRGFYDRYLTRYNELLKSKLPGHAQMPSLVGLALREQILEEGRQIPTDENDWKMEIVISAD